MKVIEIDGSRGMFKIEITQKRRLLFDTAEPAMKRR